MTTATRDFSSGEYVEGFEAIAAQKAMENTHAGLLTDERVAQDATALDHANDLVKQTPGIDDMTSQTS